MPAKETKRTVFVRCSMKGDVEMSKEEGLRKMTYQMVMRASWKMLQSGLLSEDEYLAFEAKMREKYRPVIGLLFSDMG
jgi:hypothetical protein